MTTLNQFLTCVNTTRSGRPRPDGLRTPRHCKLISLVAFLVGALSQVAARCDVVSLPAATSSTTGGATVELAPDASVFAGLTVPAGAGGAAASSLTYYLEVSGPSTVGVTLDVTGEALVAFSGAVEEGLSATAFNVLADIELEGAELFIASCGNELADCGPLGVEGTVKTGILSNTVYKVKLNAAVSANNTFVDTTTMVSALVDPKFAIDPSFTTPGYTLALSNGIGNEFTPPAAVPEPGSLWILSTFLLALLIYRAAQLRLWRRASNAMNRRVSASS